MVSYSGWHEVKLRILISLGIVGIFAAISWFAWPQTCRFALEETASFIRQLMYEKELRLGGLAVLRQENLDLQKFRERSNPWWQLYSNTVRAALMQDPLIKDAQVKRCADRIWNCFEIKVTERQASMLAFVGDKLWMVGEDGGFMGPVPERIVQGPDWSLNLQKLGSPVLVRGLLTTGVSPELLKSRLAYVLKAVTLINEESQQRVSSLELKPNGEMETIFLGHAFTVVFGVPTQDLMDIKEEARRFSEILEKFKQNPSVIEKIDLAFNKRAVVKLLK